MEVLWSNIKPGNKREGGGKGEEGLFKGLTERGFVLKIQLITRLFTILIEKVHFSSTFNSLEKVLAIVSNDFT